MSRVPLVHKAQNCQQFFILFFFMVLIMCVCVIHPRCHVNTLSLPAVCVCARDRTHSAQSGAALSDPLGLLQSDNRSATGRTWTPARGLKKISVFRSHRIRLVLTSYHTSMIWSWNLSDTSFPLLMTFFCIYRCYLWKQSKSLDLFTEMLIFWFRYHIIWQTWKYFIGCWV